MAASAATICILLSTYATLVSSNSPAPSPGVGLECGDVASLMSCLDYVTSGSNITVPPNDCCSGVTSMLKSSPVECLCSALKQAVSLGISLNMTRAVGLPVSCGMQAPTDQCGVSGAPIPAPAPVVPARVPSLPPVSGSAPSSPPAVAPNPPMAPVVPKPGASVPPTIATGTPAPAPMASMARGLSYSPVMVLVSLAVALAA